MQVLCTIKKSSQKINFLCASIGNELHNKIRQEKDFISFLALLGVILWFTAFARDAPLSKILLCYFEQKCFTDVLGALRARIERLLRLRG